MALLVIKTSSLKAQVESKTPLFNPTSINSESTKKILMQLGGEADSTRLSPSKAKGFFMKNQEAR